MKLLFYPVILTAIVLLASCRVSCVTPSVSVVFSRSDSIPDTGAVVGQYQKGSNFTKGTASVPVTWYRPRANYWSFEFPGDAYGSDWQIVFMPSAKTYKFTGLSHTNGSDHCEFMGCPEERCVNSVSYTVNGVSDHIGTGTSSSGTAGVTISVAY